MLWQVDVIWKNKIQWGRRIAVSGSTGQVTTIYKKVVKVDLLVFEQRPERTEYTIHVDI